MVSLARGQGSGYCSTGESVGIAVKITISTHILRAKVIAHRNKLDEIVARRNTKGIVAGGIGGGCVQKTAVIARPQIHGHVANPQLTAILNAIRI